MCSLATIITRALARLPVLLPFSCSCYYHHLALVMSLSLLLLILLWQLLSFFKKPAGLLLLSLAPPLPPTTPHYAHMTPVASPSACPAKHMLTSVTSHSLPYIPRESRGKACGQGEGGKEGGEGRKRRLTRTDEGEGQGG